MATMNYQIFTGDIYVGTAQHVVQSPLTPHGNITVK